VSTASPAPEPLAASLEALGEAVARAERALEKSRGGAERAADAQDELAAMQDDRTRLAQELNDALEAGRALKAAHAEAEKRVAAAVQWVEKALAAAAAHEGE